MSKKTTAATAPPVVDPIPLPELADVPAEPSPPVYEVEPPAWAAKGAGRHVLAPWGRRDALPRPPVLTPARSVRMDRSVRVYVDGLPPRPVARGVDGGAF